MAVNKENLAYFISYNRHSLACEMFSLYLYVFSFPRREKRLPDHSFLKLKS